MAFPQFIGITNQSILQGSANSYAVPAGAQVGDLLFVMANLSAASSSNLVMPSGWTLVQENAADAFREKLVVGFRVHDGSANYSFSASNPAGGRIRLVCYRGQAASNPINSSAAAISFAGGATLASTPIAAAAGVDSIELLFAASLDANNTSVSGSGVTSRANSSTYLSFDLADAQATAGSNTTAKTFTWGLAGTKRTIINVVVSGTAAAAVVPQGTTTIGTISGVTASAASVPFTYSASDQTGFEYRINGGTPVAVASSPISLTGLTASTTYTVEVRAVNATGAGTWSTSTQFTTSAAAQVPQGTVTVGTVTGITNNSASVPFTYSASDQTGFQYRLNGGTATTVPSGISPIALSGLTASTAYTIEVRAVNATGNGAWSAVSNFSTTAAPQVPQGTFTIGTITASQTTASVPFTYSASDQTSIQYRLNSGAAQTASASPQSLTGLTASTAYTIEFRAVNATGNGAWSSVANFTTTAPVTASFTLIDLVNNAGAPQANTSGITVDVYNIATGALVVRKTGLTSTAGADLAVSDAALVAGTTYNVVISIGAAIGAAKATAA